MGMTDEAIEYYGGGGKRLPVTTHMKRLHNLWQEKLQNEYALSIDDLPEHIKTISYGRDLKILSYKNMIEGLKSANIMLNIDIDIDKLDDKVYAEYLAKRKLKK